MRATRAREYGSRLTRMRISGGRPAHRESRPATLGGRSPGLETPGAGRLAQPRIPSGEAPAASLRRPSKRNQTERPARRIRISPVSVGGSRDCNSTDVLAPASRVCSLSLVRLSGKPSTGRGPTPRCLGAHLDRPEPSGPATPGLPDLPSTRYPATCSAVRRRSRGRWKSSWSRRRRSPWV